MTTKIPANTNEQNPVAEIALETRVQAFQDNARALDRMSISPRAKDMMTSALLKALALR